MTNINIFTNQINSDETEFFEDIYINRGEVEGRRMARFHVAIKYLLSAYELSSSDISDQVLTDRQDQGIDFFYVSQDNTPVVYVIQIKDHENLGLSEQREAVSKMHTEIKFLLDRSRISNDWSEKRKERFSDLKELRNTEFRIEYVLVLTGNADASVSTADFDSSWFDDSLRTLKVIDKNGLAELVQFSTSPRPLNALLTLAPSATGVQGERNGSPRFVFGLMTVENYCKATESLGVDLFSLNPRLFLPSTSGPNAKMLETLNSPIERKNFHLLNNGITAICKRLTYNQSPDLVTAKVEGFLVVNGCQTTETLWKWFRDPSNRALSREVSVMIRIIETVDDSDLAQKISQTTNSQTSILSSDLIANDEFQKRIKTALENSSSRPVFYENRRGALRKITVSEKEVYKIAPDELDGRGWRTTTLREMAQILQSVTGLPEQAKEGVSSLFKPENLRYRQIFGESWEDPEQLLLIVDLYKFVCKKSLWINHLANKDEQELASLGRYYITHLIYETWRGDGRPHFDSNINFYSKLIDAEKSDRLRQNLAAESKALAWLATRSLAIVLERDEDRPDGKRALLRISEYKTDIRKTFLNLILTTQ